jgi:3',5'-cyclic AMP phosphodiesterase CpdA
MRNSKCGMRNKIVVITIVLVLLSIGRAFAAQDQQIEKKLAALEALDGKFSFVVLGDNRSDKSVYKKLAIMAMALKPDFIVNTGDLIETPGDQQQWLSFWSMSKLIDVPYFLTVGNHDISPLVPASERIYKEQVDLPGNELFYSFPVGNSLFVVLDSYMEGQEKKITGNQQKWLEGVLAKPDKKHLFVFLHHPLYTDYRKGRHWGDCLDKYPDDRDRLQAIFVKSQVDVVFSGHEHFYQRKTVNGIEHVITGGAGAPLYVKDEEGGFNHFLYVTVDGSQVSAEVIDRDGKVRDRFPIQPIMEETVSAPVGTVELIDTKQQGR